MSSLNVPCIQAILCSLADCQLDIAHQLSQRLITAYENQHPSLQARFVCELVCAFIERDVDRFSAACQTYDEIDPLDAWNTSILLTTKRVLEKVVEAEEEDGHVIITASTSSMEGLGEGVL